MDRIRESLGAVRALTAALAMLMVASILLGGSTHSGYLSDVILEALAAPVLLVVLWFWAGEPMERLPLPEMAFCAAMFALPLAQLIDLPPNFWLKLPHGELRQSAQLSAQVGLAWGPLSLVPSETWLCVVAIVPPIAIFLGTAYLPAFERRIVVAALLSAGLVSAGLGLLQVAQGPGSLLRPFALTNPSEAVGFFANRNHLAALLYTVLLLATAWAAHGLTSEQADKGHSAIGNRTIIASVAGFTVIVILLSAEAMARSRAGIGLTMFALVGCFVVAWTGNPKTQAKDDEGFFTGARLIMGAASLAGLLVVQFALYRIMDRFADDPLKDARIQFSRNTFAAALDAMPWGSGLGSFVKVYPIGLSPRDQLLDTFANHAHNDVVEFWLEAGLPGLVLMIVFVSWFAWQCVALWKRTAPQMYALDLKLARSASLAALLLIAHSLVDYPLRTEAMMAVFALACGLMTDVTPVAAAIKPHDFASARTAKQYAAAGSAAANRKPSPAFLQLELTPKGKPQVFAPTNLSMPPRKQADLWQPDQPWPDAWTPSNLAQPGQWDTDPQPAPDDPGSSAEDDQNKTN